MSQILSSRIQNIAPDSIEYADNLQLAVRANGEEVVSFIDIAGNIYPCEIPEAVNAPSFTGLTVAADGVTPIGYYGYRYVYVASKRYPLVDGGRSFGGSIAPRGNPSPTLVVNLTVDNNYINLTIPSESRKDIDEVWIFRTTNYATSANAQLAIDAGLCFYIGKAVNTPGGAAVAFQDKVPTPSVEQIEFDNFAAPTFKYVRFIPPYFWGIGNDQLIVPVTWSGKIVTITDSRFQFFTGRNGQSATLSGVTTGGVDGRGTFIFKAGDEAGFNTTINAILTKDGTTAETLVPSTGTGYITIDGVGNILYRSKPNNPFAWGFTQRIGSAIRAAIYTLAVATGKASAIIGLPEDQQLKIDFKNPAACYTFNLRVAGTSEFGSTRRLISNYSLSSHSSQFFASSEGRKVLWGWDVDTFAILQSDGNSQNPISQNVFQTLRNAVRDPFRIQFAHGLCDDENELNCLWIPYTGEINYEQDYPSTLYKQTSITDLLIYQHYPSGKWGFNSEFDLTAATKIRDLNLNKLKIIGGTEQGLVLHINDNTAPYNIETVVSGFQSPVTVDESAYPNSLTFTTGTFTGIPLTELVGTWGILYKYTDDSIAYCRILSLVVDTLFIDMVISPYDFALSKVLDNTGIWNDPAKTAFNLGGIPQFLRKEFEFSAPTKLKKIEELYLKGSALGNIQTKISNSTQTRYPFSFSSDNTQFSSTIYRVIKPALSPDDKITLQLFNPEGGIKIKGIGLKMT